MSMGNISDSKDPGQVPSCSKDKSSQRRCGTARDKRSGASCSDENKQSKRRSWSRGSTRSIKEDLVDLYAPLYARVPFRNLSEETLAKAFSDKELRIMMGANSWHVNYFNPVTAKFTEKTKREKVSAGDC
jgi:hypothetical protein